MRFVALVGVFVVVFGTASLDAFGAGGLIGHRAMYGMSLDSADAATGIVDARGAMEYRFADTCDGWTVENRTFLTINYDEGDESKTTWSFVSWESKDGLDYRFRVQHSRNDKIVEDECKSYLGTHQGVAGPDGVLAKPVDQAALMAVVERLTAGSS